MGWPVIELILEKQRGKKNVRKEEEEGKRQRKKMEKEKKKIALFYLLFAHLE
jgi:hypothetical protein